MGNKIKVTGTKVGADGTGYFRGNDGKYYYGNPQNGYLTETRQSQQARAQKQAAPSSSGHGGTASAAGGCGVGIIEGLFAGAVSVIWTAGMIAIFFILLIVSVVTVWPMFIGRLAGYYQAGNADLMVVIMSAVAIFLIGYFLLSVIRVCQTKTMRSRRFIIVCIIAMAIPAIPVGLILGSPAMIPQFAIEGAILSILPAFLLCFVEHLATKQIRRDKEWFATKIARLINRVFPFHSKGMIVFGVLVLLFSGLFNFLLDLSDASAYFYKSGGPSPAATLAMGILFIIAGITSKKKEGR